MNVFHRTTIFFGSRQSKTLDSWKPTHRSMVDSVNSAFSSNIWSKFVERTNIFLSDIFFSSWRFVESATPVEETCRATPTSWCWFTSCRERVQPFCRCCNKFDEQQNILASDLVEQRNFSSHSDRQHKTRQVGRGFQRLLLRRFNETGSICKSRSNCVLTIFFL